MLLFQVFRLVESLSSLDQSYLASLRNILLGLKKVCVAYSGGVDSSLVAAIAFEQLGPEAIAVTGISPSLAPYLLNEARLQAAWLGIEHRECETNELEDDSYRSNLNNRCYICKRELHISLQAIAKKNNTYQVVDGVNFDDINDYRPGIKAAQELEVISPLVDAKINKNSVRNISKALGLPWWDKPSEPCLASRFPYGNEINNYRLSQVAKAESWLRSNGFKEIRVRSQGLSARIELPYEQVGNFLLNIDRKKIVDYFLKIGFTSVSLDLEGLVSGKLNRKSIK